MRRLAFLLSFVLLVLSLGFSPIVHGAEAMACMAGDAAVGEGDDHTATHAHPGDPADSDADRDDAGNGDDTVMPHHHGHCHAQFAGLPETTHFAPPETLTAVRLDPAGRIIRVAAGPGPALRPPQA